MKNKMKEITLPIKHPNNSFIFISDLHAANVDLNDIKDQIKKDSNVKVIFLGDYIDRGIFPLELIEDILSLKKLYPKNVIILKGNHDEFLEDFLSINSKDDSKNEKLARSMGIWMNNGMTETLRYIYEKDGQDCYFQTKTLFLTDFRSEAFFTKIVNIKKISKKITNTLNEFYSYMEDFYEDDFMLVAHAGKRNDLWGIVLYGDKNLEDKLIVMGHMMLVHIHPPREIDLYEDAYFYDEKNNRLFCDTSYQDEKFYMLKMNKQ